jgi:hypothetical protein
MQARSTHLGGIQAGKIVQTALKSLTSHCHLVLLRPRTGGGGIQEHELSKGALPRSGQRTLGRWKEGTRLALTDASLSRRAFNREQLPPLCDPMRPSP